MCIIMPKKLWQSIPERILQGKCFRRTGCEGRLKALERPLILIPI